MSKETKICLRSVATVLVVLAVLFAFAISGVRLFGVQAYGVLTGSMTPTFPVGSLVYVKAVDPATLRVSDVITFSAGRNAVATHRIVEKVPDPENPYSFSFRTKGDANDAVDNALVRQSSIVGKVVFSLPLLGSIAAYIQHPPGTYVAIFISLVLIVFVFITDSVGEKPAAAPRQKAQKQHSPFRRKGLPFLQKHGAAQNAAFRQGYAPGQQSAQVPPVPQQAYPPQPYAPQYGAPPFGQNAYAPQPAADPPLQPMQPRTRRSQRHSER